MSELIEAFEIRTGGNTVRFMVSNPPETAVVPEFNSVVTTATPRFGSTAIAVGGPLTATVVDVGTVVVTAPGS